LALEMADHSYLSHLRILLDDIQPVGVHTFATSGRILDLDNALTASAPIVDVDNIGRLKFPIVEHSVTVQALKIAAERGRGLPFDGNVRYGEREGALSPHWEVNAKEDV
jgi:hypothetical protein